MHAQLWAEHKVFEKCAVSGYLKILLYNCKIDIAL